MVQVAARHARIHARCYRADAESRQCSASDRGVRHLQQQTGVAGGKSNVRAMLQQAQNNPPFTLTDVPGGLADKSTAEQLSVANDPSSLLSLMEGKTPEQIEQLMNSVL